MNQVKSEKLHIIKTVRVSTLAEHAFAIFVNKLDSWWPGEYTWAAESLEKIAIEPAINGRCYEIGPHGFRCDWGRVLQFEPPHRIVFTWQIDPDRVPQPNPDKASEIEVLFEEAAGETNVTFVHKHFENHGEGAEQYKEAMNSPQGWDYILDNYVKAAIDA